jgi:hypothetical protein
MPVSPHAACVPPDRSPRYSSMRSRKSVQRLTPRRCQWTPARPLTFYLPTSYPMVPMDRHLISECRGTARATPYDCMVGIECAHCGPSASCQTLGLARSEWNIKTPHQRQAATAPHPPGRPGLNRRLTACRSSSDRQARCLCRPLATSRRTPQTRDTRHPTRSRLPLRNLPCNSGARRHVNHAIERFDFSHSRAR